MVKKMYRRKGLPMYTDGSSVMVTVGGPAFQQSS